MKHGFNMLFCVAAVCSTPFNNDSPCLVFLVHLLSDALSQRPFFFHPPTNTQQPLSSIVTSPHGLPPHSIEEHTQTLKNSCLTPSTLPVQLLKSTMRNLRQTDNALLLLAQQEAASVVSRSAYFLSDTKKDNIRSSS